MSMIPDDFHFHIPNGAYIPNNNEDLNASAIPDLPFRPYPITTEGIIRLRDTLFEHPLGEQLCCASNEATNTTDKDKIKKIKGLVKKCVNLNVYIDGENIFKKILEICEGK